MINEIENCFNIAALRKKVYSSIKTTFKSCYARIEPLEFNQKHQMKLEVY